MVGAGDARLVAHAAARVAGGGALVVEEEVGGLVGVDAQARLRAGRAAGADLHERSP